MKETTKINGKVEGYLDDNNNFFYKEKERDEANSIIKLDNSKRVVKNFYYNISRIDGLLYSYDDWTKRINKEKVYEYLEALHHVVVVEQSATQRTSNEISRVRGTQILINKIKKVFK